ncbi:ATP-binding cassette domain-containing protein [Microbacterium mitrae]|uniref:ABC transporter ATP-binding protein n=1 Tax=Microbacterium mitrae TaxID=664640 RepID=A0A5C8HQN1_9MICO|nr:ATP-binding cassette domain-containing protein [Microbacterium mitrae]TXK06426.1 ABC transporter ATP-binding protein [Microbacterium mitrae]
MSDSGVDSVIGPVVGPVSTSVPPPLISTVDLSKEFVVRERGRKSIVTAVRDVSLEIAAGETLGVVGESGSGKSTLGRCILGLETPSSGTVAFDGTIMTGLGHRELRGHQRDMQIIFQDPYSSLNPRRTALQQVMEPLEVLTDHTDMRARALEALDRVGISETQAERLPRSFSGGQRQRIAIARAIVVRPRFIVCDEPVSALDMSIQAQVTELLQELQRDLGLTYLFISHDLSVVREIATRTAVMYRGQIVELGPTPALFAEPKHPYTQRLLDAVLVPEPAIARERLAHFGASVRSPLEIPADSRLVEVLPGHWVREG